MNLNQRSSRYGVAVLFLSGVCATLLFIAIWNSKLAPGFEIWLASALVVSLILHARAGFAMSRTQQEVELLKGLLDQMPGNQKAPLGKAKIKAADITTSNEQDAEILNEVRDAIDADRMDLYLQPIVSLPQRKQRYFEAFSRLRRENGKMLQPAAYLEAAERANRIGLIDNLILLRSIQSLRAFDTNSGQYRIFCNISPATIFDRAFFNRFTDYLDENSDLSSSLVFEFTYPAVEMMNRTVTKNLEAIAERGFVFSVDHIRRFDLNWRSLREKNFRYAKASSRILLSNSGFDKDSRARAESFRSQLSENNIDLIVEKVEHESDMPEILALGIDFGQGQLFGPPRPANFYVTEREALAEAV